MNLSQLPGAALLNEYVGLERWFADDYALVSPSEDDRTRWNELNDELLRRLNAYDEAQKTFAARVVKNNEGTEKEGTPGAV